VSPVEGWDEARRKQWLAYFKDLRTRLVLGESSFEWDSRHLRRAMDHDGIQSGEWWQEAGEIQSALWPFRTLEDDEPSPGNDSGNERA
jgi:hypothetical protein